MEYTYINPKCEDCQKPHKFKSFEELKKHLIEENNPQIDLSKAEFNLIK